MVTPICPVCGLEGETCGAGPTHYTPVGADLMARPRLLDRRNTVAEFVHVEVKPGEVRKFSKEDADAFIAANPDAKITGSVEPHESVAGPDDPNVPYDAGSDESTDTVTPAKGTKAQKPAEDK